MAIATGTACTIRVKVLLLKVVLAECGVADAIGGLPYVCLAGYLRRLQQTVLNTLCHKAVFYWL